MNYKSVPVPKKRSAARKWIGKRIYILRRQLHWHLSRIRYARKKEADLLNHLVIQHQSVLLRELKDVYMWLQHNKIHNLKLAVSSMNYIVLEPGEVFSFWRLVGNPVQSKGFKEGMVLENGKVKSGYGGGLCQLANLIYWMTLHTPLTITERWRHSFDVFPDVNRTIPFGCGATVSYNYIDLQIKNTTNRRYQIHLWLSDKELMGEIRSDQEWKYRYEIVEKNHVMRQEFSGHYSRHNQIFRKVMDKKSGELIREEPVTENHALMMYSPLIEQTNKKND